ncbi:MAG: hypothetical protein EXR62_00790 [Chloroflexi bacterium]|nr:hypothetical protein [Chloroflexota bacterium]
MNYSQIITQAFAIASRHRNLWIYGFILAILGGGSGGYSASINYRFNPPETPSALSTMRLDIGSFIPFLIALACLGLFISVLAWLGRILARTSLIASVVQIAKGESVSTARGFRLAMPHYRSMLAISVLFNLPALLFAAVIMTFLIVLILSSGILQSAQTGVPPDFGPLFGAFLGGAALIICLSLIFLLCLVLVELLRSLTERHCVVQGTGIMDGIAGGWQFFRRYLGEFILLVIVIGVLNIIWFSIFGALAGVAIRGMFILPLALYTSTQNLLAAVLIAIPLVTVLIIFLSLIGGFWNAFNSTMWTLAYLQLTGKGATEAGSMLTGGHLPQQPIG